ncbi:MAG: class I SAM-dependent methyltransferase [Thermodesulfobacteriota bacterium]
MTTIGENELSALLLEDVDLRLVEPHIYSVLPDNEAINAYDTRFGYIYDWVACNPLYNRLIWGYSVEIFATIARDALISAAQGNVLDLGCGSLAFTAKTYIQHSERSVVLVDQSLKMLRIAKSRLVKINGIVPDNMVFLHADALRLPFRERTFNSILSENLLHCLDDTKKLLKTLKSILSEDRKMYFTTLIRGNRFADRYLEYLAKDGKLVPRSMQDHQMIFDQLGMPIKFNINGNMASIYYDA